MKDSDPKPRRPYKKGYTSDPDLERQLDLPEVLELRLRVGKDVDAEGRHLKAASLTKNRRVRRVRSDGALVGGSILLFWAAAAGLSSIFFWEQSFDPDSQISAELLDVAGLVCAGFGINLVRGKRK